MSITTVNHPFRSRSTRIAAVALSLGLVLAACGGDDDDTAEPAEEPAPEPAAAEPAAEEPAAEEPAAEEPAAEEPAAEEPAEPSGDAPKLAVIYSAEWQDGSWGEFAYDGANSLLERGVVSEISLQENVPPGADAQNALRALADDGFNPIIAHSFNYGDDVKAVAAEYPETIFVYAGGFGDVAGNVGDYSQPFWEPAYLEGILAADVMDGAVAGAGGFDIPVCRAMKNAFLAGVQTIDPDTEGSFVAVGDWYDVQLAKEAALAQADAGATMFIGCGQGPTFGQIEAANETGGVAMGYVGDMSGLGDSVLASFTWNLEAVFERMVEDVVAGKTEAQYYEVLLKDGGMEVVISPTWEDQISAEGMAAYEAALASIEDGSFTVPFDAES
jgi:basic membrane lipoprotein Med (substrate-binding protein (PBP1-ABC) superfamily)